MCIWLLFQISDNLWDEIKQNPIVISTVIAMFVAFFIGFIAASIKDENDMNTVSVIYQNTKAYLKFLMEIFSHIFSPPTLRFVITFLPTNIDILLPYIPAVIAMLELLRLSQ